MPPLCCRHSMTTSCCLNEMCIACRNATSWRSLCHVMAIKNSQNISIEIIPETGCYNFKLRRVSPLCMCHVLTLTQYCTFKRITFCIVECPIMKQQHTTLFMSKDLYASRKSNLHITYLGLQFLCLTKNTSSSHINSYYTTIYLNQNPTIILTVSNIILNIYHVNPTYKYFDHFSLLH